MANCAKQFQISQATEPDLGQVAVGVTRKDEGSARARRIVRARTASGLAAHIDFRRREIRAFPASNPGWEILLELFSTQSAGIRLSVTDVALATNIAPATVVRWLAVLTDEGLALREPDPLDRRRIWVSLSRKGTSIVERMLDDLSSRIASATRHISEI